MNCDPPLGPAALLEEELFLVGEPFCLPGGEAGILLRARFCSGGERGMVPCVCTPGCFFGSAPCPCSFKWSGAAAAPEGWASMTFSAWLLAAAVGRSVLGFGAKKDVSMRLPEVRLLRVRSASSNSSCHGAAHHQDSPDKVSLSLSLSLALSSHVQVGGRVSRVGERTHRRTYKDRGTCTSAYTCGHGPRYGGR